MHILQSVLPDSSFVVPSSQTVQGSNPVEENDPALQESKEEGLEVGPREGFLVLCGEREGLSVGSPAREGLAVQKVVGVWVG